ncbi:MAG: hypothetical protein AB7D92_10455 [Sphaerochaeta sp.]
MEKRMLLKRVLLTLLSLVSQPLPDQRDELVFLAATDIHGNVW